MLFTTDRDITDIMTQGDIADVTDDTQGDIADVTYDTRGDIADVTYDTHGHSRRHLRHMRI